MFLRRKTWAQLTKKGIPLLFVLRPMAGGFTPPTVGEEFVIRDLHDKFELQRVRQLYEQKRIGVFDELKIALAKDLKLAPAGTDEIEENIAA